MGLGPRDDTTKPARGNERADTHTRVVALWDGGSSTYWVPPGGEISIGRASDCELVIDDPSVSRRHAKLAFDSKLTIEDLGGQNGVRVRGTRIASKAKTEIAVGDVVELG